MRSLITVCFLFVVAASAALFISRLHLHLILVPGAYSEADAARLVREVASALAFLHGLDTVHADLKPENLMLSTEHASDCVIKLVDFGCAQVTAPDSAFQLAKGSKGETANTPAYCPPEVLDKRLAKSTLDPSMDMWALGTILYIMLTGMHPFGTYFLCLTSSAAASVYL